VPSSVIADLRANEPPIPRPVLPQVRECSVKPLAGPPGAGQTEPEVVRGLNRERLRARCRARGRPESSWAPSARAEREKPASS
jgi:hypothetical protein